MNNDWDKTELGLHANFYKGNGLPKNALKDNGKYNCIHYGQLFTHYSEAITKIKSKTDYLGVLGCINDVLMPTSDVTPNGLAKASCLHMNNVVIGGDILIIRPKTELDGTFLSFVIKNSEKQILSLTTGSTVFHLYAKDMEKFKFLIPKNKIEQEKIAKSLLSANNTINYLQKVIEKKELILNGVMQELLSGKKRVLGSTNNLREVEVNGKMNKIPDDWSVEKVRGNVIIINGFSFAKSQMLNENIDNSIPILKIGNIQNNKIVNNIGVGQNYFKGDIKEIYYPIYKDLIIGLSGANAGKSGVYNSKEKSVLNQRNAIIRVSTNKINQDYFNFYWLNNLSGVLKKGIEDSAIPNISSEKIANMEIVLPKKEEQEKIANILLAMEKEIDKLKVKLKKLKLIKKGMEEQLLTGKIRLPLN